MAEASEEDLGSKWALVTMIFVVVVVVVRKKNLFPIEIYIPNISY
jgi:hypothetical protein